MHAFEYGSWWGFEVAAVRRWARTCSRRRRRTAHEELAAPTCAVPAQAAELDRLGNIRPRPAPLVKERTTMEGRTEALRSKAIVGLKACTRKR